MARGPRFGDQEVAVAILLERPKGLIQIPSILVIKQVCSAGIVGRYFPQYHAFQ